MPPFALLGIGGVALVLFLLHSGGASAVANTNLGTTAPTQNAEQAYWNNLLANLNPLATSNALGGTGGAGGSGASGLNPDQLIHDFNPAILPTDLTGEIHPNRFWGSDYSGSGLGGIGLGAASGGRTIS